MLPPGGVTGSWQVRDKNGTVYYYGSGANSQLQNSHGVFEWLLDRVQDVNGNYMTVTYWQDTANNQVYLQEIDYTGNSSSQTLSPTNKVIFTPASRTDVSVSYGSYAAVTTAYRLQTISVYGNGALAREYQLNYTYSPSSSGRSRLQSVTQIGSDGTSPLPPVNFTWSTNTPGLGSKWGLGDVDSLLRNYLTVDLNRDGKADVIYETCNIALPSHFRALSSTGGGFSADTFWGVRTADYDYTNTQTFQMADLNGDGYPDLVYLDSKSLIHVLLNNGSGFLPDETISGSR